MAEWLRGRLAEAERAFVSSIAGWRAAGQPTLTAWGRYELGQVQRAQGRLDAAARTCQQALESTAVPGRPPLPAAGPAYVGLAEVAYQRNELDTRAAACHRGHRAVPPVRLHPAAGRGPGRRWRGSGRPAAIRPGPWRRSARPCRPRRARPGLLNPVPAQRARLLLAQGDLAAAARWTQETGLAADDEPDYPREPGHLVLARVLLAQDRPGQALALLDRLHAAAAAQDRVGSLIEVGALRALALAASGEEAAAVDALAGALTLACPQGYVRVFADEGPPMAALLGRLIAAQRAGAGRRRRSRSAAWPGSSARLTRRHVAPGRRRGAAVTAVPGLVEQLTSRELEVLGMLAAGRSNQAIASQLVVTLDTVKKHVSHVLGKLGAANRTEAVARARELGLIP